MRYAGNYIDKSLQIIKGYQGAIPFHLHLKKYFSAHKESGARDRKLIASLCYHYFRLGKAFQEMDDKERMLRGTFLCESKPDPLLETFRPEWNAAIEKPIEEKLAIAGNPSEIQNLFPFEDNLSNGIAFNKYNLSFLIQPALFLRVRPGFLNKVRGKLSGAGFSYHLLSPNSMVLPNASGIDEVLEPDKEAVIQDYSSQKAGELMQWAMEHSLSRKGTEPLKVWDCCAASGGKSIMAFDIDPTIKLTVSDKRESILVKLKDRFSAAGIREYTSLIADLSVEGIAIPETDADMVIADVPCTGSGTWARTPEQLYYFSKKKIDDYNRLQKRIIENISRRLRPGASILYITCSVFKKENEDVVNHAVEKCHLTLQKMELLKGYEMQADSMFTALLTRPL